MVYYPVSDAKLYEEIEIQKPDWLITARQRKDDNVNGQALVWKDSTWSQIKPVFMRRQADKCVYCEFPLGGRSTQDVEHYRPKSKISVWPTGGTVPYEFTTGEAGANGYYWLAYDPMNYAASCKDCNSALKRDAFPILSNRGAAPLIPEAPHTLCARSFHELMKSNPARAVELHEEASDVPPLSLTTEPIDN
jgi:hypothetical protein